MKEFLPLAIMQGPAGSDKLTASTAAGGPNTAPVGGFSALSTDAAAADASFSESLAGLLLTGGPAHAALTSTVAGGNTLPLAANTAKAVPDTASSAETVLSGQQETTTGVAVPTAASAIAQQGLRSATTVGMVEAAVPSSQHPIKPVADPMLAGPSSPAAQALPMQGDPASNQITAAITADLPIARMQRILNAAAPLTKSPAVNTAVESDRFVRPGMTPLTVPLTGDAAVNQTEPLAASRIQLTAMNQSMDLAGQRPVPDPTPGGSQLNAFDGSLAASARATASQVTTAFDSAATSGQATIAEAFGKPEWGQGMSKQVLWLVNQNISRAEIRLNPANLGPIEVRIDLDNDQVNVAFSSRHAEVREAVELAMPRLREMLEEKGLNLADADVSRHSFAEQQRAFALADEYNRGTEADTAFSGGDDLLTDPVHASSDRVGMTAMQAEGLVDYYV